MSGDSIVRAIKHPEVQLRRAETYTASMAVMRHLATACGAQQRCGMETEETASLLRGQQKFEDADFAWCLRRGCLLGVGEAPSGACIMVFHGKSVRLLGRPLALVRVQAGEDDGVFRFSRSKKISIRWSRTTLE